MARDYLGLFDTPPNRTEIRIGLAIVAQMLIILLATLPVHNLHIGAIPGLIPALDAGMLACDLISAAILYAQAAVFRSRALTLLASGYVVSGLLLIPWALTFPGAFSAGGLLGAKVNTTGWIAVCWRLSVPVAVFFYAWLKHRDATNRPVAERPPARVLEALLISIAIAISVTLLATLGHDLLPSFFIDQSQVIQSRLVTVNMVVIGWTIAAMVRLFRQEKSVLDLWLLVAMSAWLAQSLLNLLLQSRFSLGAYVFLSLTLMSNLVVMLALITESNRLYGRLALSTAARDRERDARLMSMDAVAAAMAHELGQPLAAAKLSASAALGWLTRSKPDVERASRSLRETLDSGERTFDVIKSIRATFATGAKAVSEISLNELARDTVQLMDRELAARKVALQLSLDEALPTVLANRVQVQRVLINLLTNAIESMATIRGRPRRIAIRSSQLDGQNVQLDVSDTGVGISPEKMAQIFEPFFTTKSTGTGLGLSLSRTIIEEHGGRLWVSSGQDYGVTFHVQMKCRPKTS